MSEFGYILEKISSSSFARSPFRFVLIDDFLSREHFEAITAAPELNRPTFPDTESLIRDLRAMRYEVQHFPGCSRSVDEYLSYFRTNHWPTKKFMVDGDKAASELLEGFGLTFRLQRYQTPIVGRFIEFLGSEEFKAVLEEKFEITRSTSVETAIQKYLHGYEISPHPDVRRKCLTYMLNLNTSSSSEQAPIHTHLLEFKPERRYVYDFWKSNPEFERCWVPWDWCETVVETRGNNSIVIFAPSNDTLHAVKLRYDHLKFQRTQAYGNFWFDDEPSRRALKYRDLDSLPGARSFRAPGRLSRWFRRKSGSTGPG